MESFLNLPRDDQQLYMQETAANKSMAPIVIEKDFWVCWILGQLFALPKIGDHLTFKGGTSLSKVFGAIDRFSEDIDLAIHREYLGFGGDKEPEEAASGKERERRLTALSKACIETVRSEVLPALRDSVGHGIAVGSDALEIDPSDPQTILFHYPRIQKSGSEYIRPFVKMEFGARSDDWPLETHYVQSYLEEEMSSALRSEEHRVHVMAAERTFWEKATILHAEYHRPAHRGIPDRQSRHYYDLYCLANHPVCEIALQKVNLLTRVAEHKSLFFRSGWANYGEAKPGGLRMSPRTERVGALERDYSEMREMFFSEPPAFSEIMKSLSDLELRINQGSAP